MEHAILLKEKYEIKHKFTCYAKYVIHDRIKWVQAKIKAQLPVIYGKLIRGFDFAFFNKKCELVSKKQLSTVFM